jgi:hypothetical protein
MQFLALIYQNEAVQKGFSREEWGKIYVEYQAVARALGEKGQLKAGYAMQPVSNTKTVRVRDGKVNASNGPAIETPDPLSAVNLIEAPDLDAALELAAKFPSARWGSVEVRPLMEYKGTSTETYQ